MKSQCFVDDPDEWKTQAAANQLELIDLRQISTILPEFSLTEQTKEMWPQDLVTSTTN